MRSVELMVLIVSIFNLAVLPLHGLAQVASPRDHSVPIQPLQQTPEHATTPQDHDAAEFAGVGVCIQNENYTGSVWHPSMCIDLASLSLDEAYTYIAAIHVEKPLVDTDVPTIRLGGLMPNGNRTWLVNFSHAAKTAVADDTHPLHCTGDGDAYRCQWYTTANAQEWSDFQKLQLANVTNIPSFFVVPKAFIARQSFISKLAARRQASLIAGQLASNEATDWYYKDDNEDGAECHKLSGTPKQFADNATKRGASEVETTGDDVLHSDVVITYTSKGHDFSYSFYKSHQQCSNPFGAPDMTSPNFARIGHDVDSSQEKADQALGDEALRRAGDRGPWWVFDGTKMDPHCVRSRITPLQDAQRARAHGARNVQIHGGLMASNVPHPDDVVVEYDLNGKGFYNDYINNKTCDAGIH